VYAVETDRDVDGRWIADIPTMPGVMAYGQSREDAIERVHELARRVTADGIETDGPSM